MHDGRADSEGLLPETETDHAGNPGEDNHRRGMDDYKCKELRDDRTDNQFTCNGSDGRKRTDGNGGNGGRSDIALFGIKPHSYCAQFFSGEGIIDLELFKTLLFAFVAATWVEVALIEGGLLVAIRRRKKREDAMWEADKAACLAAEKEREKKKRERERKRRERRERKREREEWDRKNEEWRQKIKKDKEDLIEANKWWAQRQKEKKEKEAEIDPENEPENQPENEPEPAQHYYPLEAVLSTDPVSDEQQEENEGENGEMEAEPKQHYYDPDEVLSTSSWPSP